MVLACFVFGRTGMEFPKDLNEVALSLSSSGSWESLVSSSGCGCWCGSRQAGTDLTAPTPVGEAGRPSGPVGMSTTVTLVGIRPGAGAILFLLSSFLSSSFCKSVVSGRAVAVCSSGFGSLFGSASVSDGEGGGVGGGEGTGEGCVCGGGGCLGAG